MMIVSFPKLSTISYLILDDEFAPRLTLICKVVPVGSVVKVIYDDALSYPLSTGEAVG